MSSSNPVDAKSGETVFNLFDQRHYNNTFYYCDKDHPFIAFITCFCPLCEKIEEAMELSADCLEIEEALDDLTEKYQELYVNAKNHCPELLL
jgi:hypothetical protein